MRKAKIKLELNMAKDAKWNKKSFYRYVSQKSKVERSVYSPDEQCWKTGNNQWGEGWGAQQHFASVFNGDLSSHTSWVCGLQDVDWGNKVLPSVSKDQVYDHLRHLIVCKSMGPNEINPRILRELANVVAKLVSIIFEKSLQSGEVPGSWKRETLYLSLKKTRRKYCDDY